MVINNVAAKKRTQTQREADLAEMAKLDLRGYTTRAIGKLFGLSHVQIAKDLQKLRLRYAESAMLARHEAVVEKLAQLRDVRAEAWSAWEGSKKKRKRKVKERISESLDADGNATPETVSRIKDVITTEGRLPANEYLTTILRTLEEESELLGLYAPKKSEISGPDGSPLTVMLVEEIVTANANASDDSTASQTAAVPPAGQ